eukprot:scaffold53469_cov27-Tisochrysis_lutea.AAC.5
MGSRPLSTPPCHGGGTTHALGACPLWRLLGANSLVDPLSRERAGARAHAHAAQERTESQKIVGGR